MNIKKKDFKKKKKYECDFSKNASFFFLGVVSSADAKAG